MNGTFIPDHQTSMPHLVLAVTFTQVFQTIASPLVVHPQVLCLRVFQVVIMRCRQVLFQCRWNQDLQENVELLLFKVRLLLFRLLLFVLTSHHTHELVRLDFL